MILRIRNIWTFSTWNAVQEIHVSRLPSDSSVRADQRKGIPCQINKKQGEIYLTVFDFDVIWYVDLWSRVYASHQFIGQPDLQVQR